VSATPHRRKKPLWTGFLRDNGSPAIQLRIKGPLGPGREFEATIDTGFTGFLSIPILVALPLGLVLYGTTSVAFANGDTGLRLTAAAEIVIHEESRVGTAVLEPSSTEILVGIDFLRKFGKAVFLSSRGVTLVDEDLLLQNIGADND